MTLQRRKNRCADETECMREYRMCRDVFHQPDIVDSPRQCSRDTVHAAHMEYLHADRYGPGRERKFRMEHWMVQADLLDQMQKCRKK